MPSPTRLAGALDALLTELTETVAWESEIAAEARRAAGRRERLAFSVRATIGTLPEADRPPALQRLRETLGAPEPPPGTPRRTDRTRIVRDWLARRETPDFQSPSSARTWSSSATASTAATCRHYSAVGPGRGWSRA